MTGLLERLLNLQRGDLARGFLLFLYLFLVMTSYLSARVARDALFLDKYSPDKLPFADLAIAVLVGLVMVGYVAISRRLILRNLLVSCLLLVSASSFAFWWLSTHYGDAAWVYPVIYIWVGLWGVLGPVQVWTLANYVFTVREAKRIFSLVAGGSIAGGVFGGRFSSYMARQFGTPSLLIAIGLFLAVCSLLVVAIWRQRRAPVASEEEEAAAEVKRPTVVESLKLIGSGRYLRVLAGLIWIASVVTSVAGWQFKALAKYHYYEKFHLGRDQLAGFFGDFYFYAGLAGLLVQLLVTNRLLKRFGLGPALFVVPVALFLASLGVLGWGLVTIWAAIGLRSSINVLQYSIDKPSVELLYLPVPVEIKNQVKSFIDTVIWRFGDGFAAALLVVFVTTLGWSAVQASWLSMALILWWLGTALVARRRYVITLRDIVRQHRLDAEQAAAPVLDRSTSEIFASHLTATDPKEILYALSLFEVSPRTATHPAIRGLLSHPAPEVRQKAIAILSAAGDRSVLPQVEALLKDPSLEVRTEALTFLTRHAHVDPLACIQELGGFPDFSIRSAMVAFLARPGETQNLVAARTLLRAMVKEEGPEATRTRLEAARLLSVLPPEFDEEHSALISDSDPEVVREAIRAAGNLRARRMVLRVVDRLADPALVPDAVEALAKFGDRVVGTLRDYLTDAHFSLEGRRQIPAILVRIGSPAAMRVLQENMLEADPTLRMRIISSMNKLRQMHPEVDLDTQMIESMLAAEILGHYRGYQILGTLGTALDNEEPMALALQQSMQEDVERIFRLLSLLFPHYDFHSAYVGLQSSNRAVHDNALEFLDNILKPQLRNVLVPLLDSDVTIDERVRLANRMVGARVEGRVEAVLALLASADPWLKSCGAYAVGKLGLFDLGPDLDACLDHPDPLLRETARQAKLRLHELRASSQPASVSD